MFKLIVKQTIYVNAFDKQGNDIGNDSGEYAIKPGEYTISKLDGPDINGLYIMSFKDFPDPKVHEILMAPEYIEEDCEWVSDYIEIKWVSKKSNNQKSDKLKTLNNVEIIMINNKIYYNYNGTLYTKEQFEGTYF